MMTPEQLCAWLRETSSGIYRPAADAAALIERLQGEAPDGLYHWMPRLPTPEQLRAAQRHGVEPELAKTIYLAMMDARPRVRKPT